MTPDTDREPSLREHLDTLQAALDEASRQQMFHIAEHHCRPGHGDCRAGDYWARQVSAAQYRLGMTRFLNEDD